MNKIKPLTDKGTSLVQDIILKSLLKADQTSTTEMYRIELAGDGGYTLFEIGLSLQKGKRH